MNTLIELYDERAIENILAPDIVSPAAHYLSLFPVRFSGSRRGSKSWRLFIGNAAGNPN